MRTIMRHARGHPAAPRWLGGCLADLADQAAERLGDGPVTIPGRVLVDHRRTDAGMAEPGHQLLETRARGRRERAARVPEIMEMQAGQAYGQARLVPDLAEVRPAQAPALRADEH